MYSPKTTLNSELTVDTDGRFFVAQPYLRVGQFMRAVGSCGPPSFSMLSYCGRVFIEATVFLIAGTWDGSLGHFSHDHRILRRVLRLLLDNLRSHQFLLLFGRRSCEQSRFLLLSTDNLAGSRACCCCSTILWLVHLFHFVWMMILHVVELLWL